MSSQFSYELDERQIRMLLQDAEIDYNEALWHKFDELVTARSKSSHNISNYIPKINFSISRSIIVPVLFIVFIGGLSAMLFSFVDFKKKQAIEKEMPIVAKSEKIKEPVIIPKQIIKPKLVVATVIKTNSIATETTTETSVAAIKKEEPIKVAEVKPKEKEITVPVIAVKKETFVNPVKKKSKKKLKPQDLPIINTSTDLNEGVNEPELELDLK